MVKHLCAGLIAVVAACLWPDAAGAQKDAKDTATKDAGRPSHSSDELATWLDDRFEEFWKEADVAAFHVIDDATFLRRTYLDLVGTIPSVAKARDFLADDNPK